MSVAGEHEHLCHCFPLEENSYELMNIVKPTKLRNNLRTFLKKELYSPTHCPICGGLLPELCFAYEGKEYFFTCYKIVRKANSKVIAETDYDKLGEYAQVKGRASRSSMRKVGKASQHA